MLYFIILFLSSFFDLSFQVLNLLLQLLINESLLELIILSEITDFMSLYIE